MYILTGDKKQIINSDFVERFCISEKPDASQAMTRTPR